MPSGVSQIRRVLISSFCPVSADISPLRPALVELLLYNNSSPSETRKALLRAASRLGGNQH